MSENLIAGVKGLAVERFAMWIGGIHGPEHWERVRENAAFLAKHSGGDALVAQLFAYLHDCCRESDGADPNHGARAAKFVDSLGAERLKLDANQFELLKYACEHHEKGRLSENPTVGACWDADRLDLGRVGPPPEHSISLNGMRQAQIGDRLGLQTEPWT